MSEVEKYIKSIPDFPKPGIIFRDVTSVTEDPEGMKLAIDEMDATMYPASQVELLKILRKYASKLNLQILFTTHSMSLLKVMDDLVQEVSKQEETAK